jgi:hypothetical protein
MRYDQDPPNFFMPFAVSYAADRMAGSASDPERDVICHMLQRLGPTATEKYNLGFTEMKIFRDGLRRSSNINLEIILFHICEESPPFYNTRTSRIQLKKVAGVEADAHAPAQKVFLLHHHGSPENEANGTPPGHYALLLPKATVDKFTEKDMNKNLDRRVFVDSDPDSDLAQYYYHFIPNDGHCGAQAIATYLQLSSFEVPASSEDAVDKYLKSAAASQSPQGPSTPPSPHMAE